MKPHPCPDCGLNCYCRDEDCRHCQNRPPVIDADFELTEDDTIQEQEKQL